MHLPASAADRKVLSWKKKPLGGKLGTEILDNICADCWTAWDDQQIKLINEYRLNLGIPQHNQMLQREMKLFFKLIEPDPDYQPMQVDDAPAS